MEYIDEIRKIYGFKKHLFTFIGHSECIVYHIYNEQRNEKYVLRIHKPNKKLNIFKTSDSFTHLNEQILFLNRLHKLSNKVYSCSIKNIHGKDVTILSDGTCATVLLWINGESVNNIHNSSELLYEIGSSIAKFHMYSKKIERQFYISRKLPGVNILVGSIENLIKKDYIKKEFISIMKNTIQELSYRLHKRENNSYGIIHADITPTNLIYNGKEIIPIDFGMSCVGDYYFDLGALMANFYNAEEQKYILNGYEDVSGCKVELESVELFLVYYILLSYITQYELLSEREDYNKIMEEWCYGIFVKFYKRRKLLI